MSDISFNSTVPLVNIVVTPAGLNGRDGIDGAPGRDGVDGVPGRDGVDGAPGRDGIDGTPGRDGTDGQDGLGISTVSIDERNHLMLTLSDGSTQDAGLLDAVDQTMLDTIARLEDVRITRANAPSNRGTEPYSDAVLTFIDDDGTSLFLSEHVPVYKRHGVTATTAVVACRAIETTGLTTSGDSYQAMSFEELRSLARDGFDVQNHTWSHDRAAFNSAYNQDATDAYIDLEYKRADEAFRANGFDCNCMVFPWGAHQTRHLALARRYTRFGVNCRGMDGMNDANTNPMDLNRLAAQSNGSNLAQLKASVDTAILRGCWLIIMTHAGGIQPDAASLDELLTYAQTTGIRIENFREAARLKAPAYYAGQGDTAFRVMPDGRTKLSIEDSSLSTMIARAYELGFISPMANAIDTLTAVWTGGILQAGSNLDISSIAVTAHLHDGSTRAISDFTVVGSLSLSEGENALTIRYGTVSATLTVTAVSNENPATTLLAEYTTIYGSAGDRERVWFARHMDAGTYALHIVLSEPMGADTSSVSSLVLKTASVFGEITGTELLSVPASSLQGVTVYDTTITLTEATDGFFLFSKLLKKGIRLSLYVNGQVTDSDLLSIPVTATLQGSAATPGVAWVPIDLPAGEHAYKLEVGGAAGTSNNVITVRTATTDRDTEGTRILAYTGYQCTGGVTIMDAFTLTEATSYLYVSYLPNTKSTFTLTLSVV